MAQFIDCMIIGGGQAGLAMSHCLQQAGVEHLVFERGLIAHRWTSARWPSLRLLTPGWMTRLPGRQLANSQDGFLTAGDLAVRLKDYAGEHFLPVIENIDVLALERLGERFRAVTSRGTWIARSVVIATGACDRPRTPRWASQLSPSIHQLASSAYRGADTLPEGGVMVVGASATGVQIASEIALSGRSTMLAAGNHVRSPRRYRGCDLFEWLDACGFLSDPTPSGRSPVELFAQPSMQLVGSDDNRDVSLTGLADQGVVIGGHVSRASGSVVAFDDDLTANLQRAEQRRRGLLDRIDDYISRAGIEAPLEKGARRQRGVLVPLRGAVDLQRHGVSSVIWATGYRRDYSWLQFDACDGHGELRQAAGVCEVPHLYALGLPFMRHRASSFIDGVGRDAEALAPIIAARLGATTSLQAA